MAEITEDFAVIDATMQAFADQITDFTDEITTIASEGAVQIGVDAFVDPVQTVRGLDGPFTQQRPIALLGTNQAVFAEGGPGISTPSIGSLTLPSSPTAPALDFGTAPATTTFTVPTAPIINDVSVGAVPDVSIPSVPSLAQVDIPALVVPVLPTYDFTLAEIPDSLVSPVNNFVWDEQEYVSSELTNLRNLLNDDLVNGGWGVTHQDEEDLFERQRERIRDESLLQEEELFDSFAARGFDVPQGDQIDQVRVLQKQTLDKLQETNLDISTARADLIRRSRENVISQANSLNGTMIQYWGFVQQRLLQASEFLASYAIQVFNAQVERHNLLIAEYNARVGAYQARVAAVVQQLEISKIQLEAESLKNEINRSTVELYQAQIDAATSIIQLYQAEVDAAKTISDIERNKLEIFRAEIDAYKSQIDGEVSKANLYATQLGAEEVKSRVFGQQVDAYEAEVRAVSTLQSSRVEEARLEIQADGLQLEKYRANIDRFRAEIEKSSSDLRSLAARDSNGASLYGSYVSSYAQYLDTLIREEEVEVRASVQESEIQSRNARFNAEAINQQIEMQSRAATAAAQVFGQHAQAYASINSNLDIGVN